MNGIPRTRAEGRISKPLIRAYAGLFFTMIVWSMIPVFIKNLLTVLTPTEVSFSRFLLSGAVLLTWVLFRRRDDFLRIFRQDFKLLLLCTVFGPLTAMVCFNFGIQYVTIGTAAVFAAVEPFVTYILAVMIGQETWKPSRMLSVLFALGGITLVVLSRNEWGVVYWVSLALLFLSPVVWAANNIFSKEMVKRHTPIVLVSSSFVLSSLFLVPTLSPGYVHVMTHMGLGLWLSLAYCMASTIIGFNIWYWSLGLLPPTTVAVSMYIIPVFSVISGMVFLGETMSWMKGSGIATVLLGLYLVNVRFR